MTNATQPDPPPPPPAASATDSPGAGKAVALGLAFVGILVWAVAAGAFYPVAFVFALIASVMLHEAGHFVVAKRSGMKVTEFFFGFGPKLWSTTRGETTYGVKAIPAGGYVKIVGMSNLEVDVDPADEPRTYRQQSYPKRMAVALAGIVTHFIIAFVLLMLLWTVIGIPDYNRPRLEIGSISRLETGPSPAQEAGLEVGDRLISVDGRTLGDWRELPVYVRERAGQRIELVVERGGREMALVANLADANPAGEQVGFLGVGAAPTIERTGIITAAGRSVSDIGRLFTGSFSALGSFFTPSSLRNYGELLTGTEKPVTAEDTRFLSVVGVVRIAGQAADNGVFTFIFLLVLLNVFVAVFNLVPLLPLDGGHVAIATYERIRSRKGRVHRADVAKLMPLTAAVVVLLVAIGVTALWLDIVNPASNPFQ